MGPREAARRLLTPITPGAKRAVVSLFALTWLLAGANLLFTVHQVAANDRKFCAVVTGLAAAPAPPAAGAASARQRDWHERFAALSRDLGC